MTLRRYLPSIQFSLLALSLFLSGGLVYAAQRITAPASTPNSVAVASNTDADNADTQDWQSSLGAVQAASGVSLPAAPDPATVSDELKAAQSSNVTDTVSRTLVVNLMNAEQQGMGDDTPTQDQLINTALSQIPNTSSDKHYAESDLDTVPDSPQAEQEYGNATMEVLIQDSHGEYGKTMIIVDDVTSQNDPTELQGLPALGKTYQTIAQQLLATPVPTTLAPFQLELINDYVDIAATYSGMGSLLSDPIAGLSALQQYNLLTQDAGEMFINIAQSFSKDDILFSKDDPGANWAIVLQQLQQEQQQEQQGAQQEALQLQSQN